MKTYLHLKVAYGKRSLIGQHWRFLLLGRSNYAGSFLV